MIKAQIPLGGRGKLGENFEITDNKEFKEKIANLFEYDFGGFKAKKIFVEKKLMLCKNFI